MIKFVVYLYHQRRGGQSTMRTRYYEVRTYKLTNRVMDRVYAICENVRTLDTLDRYYVTKMYCTVKPEHTLELETILGAIEC